MFDLPWLKQKLDRIDKETRYTEEHQHHIVRWFTARAPQTATEWCWPVAGHISAAPYRAISGNGDYGSDPGDTAQVFGADDIPITGMVRGDFDEILPVANSSNSLYICRLVWGTGTVADAVAAGQYSEFPFFRPAADNNRKVMLIPTPMIPIQIGGLDVQIWIQVQNTVDNATLDFIIGVHGYAF